MFVFYVFLTKQYLLFFIFNNLWNDNNLIKIRKHVTRKKALIYEYSFIINFKNEFKFLSIFILCNNILKLLLLASSHRCTGEVGIKCISLIQSEVVYAFLLKILRCFKSRSLIYNKLYNKSELKNNYNHWIICRIRNHYNLRVMFAFLFKLP